MRECEFSSYHPSVNFFYFLAVICLTMFSLHPVFLLAGTVIVWLYSCFCTNRLGSTLQRRSPMRLLLHDFLLILPFLIFMVIIRPIFYNNGATVLFYVNSSRVTLETIIYGLTLTLLLFEVLLWFRCFRYFITSDKLIYLFGKAVPSVAMIISMVFRFIPLLKARYMEITYGQIGLGRRPETENLFQKCSRVIKQLSILIAWSLEASIGTADSMEARGYGLKGRSCFHLFRFSKRDAAMLAVIFFLTAASFAGFVTGRFQITFYPEIIMKKPDIFTTVSAVCYFMLCLLPVGIELEGAIKWKQYDLNI